MKNLTLKTETIRVLSSAELDGVAGGLVTSSALRPTATAVSSAHPGHGPVSSIRPTATAVSSAHPGPIARPTSTAVSSVNHGGPVSSVRPGTLSSIHGR